MGSPRPDPALPDDVAIGAWGDAAAPEVGGLEDIRMSDSESEGAGGLANWGDVAAPAAEPTPRAAPLEDEGALAASLGIGAPPKRGCGRPKKASAAAPQELAALPPSLDLEHLVRALVALPPTPVAVVPFLGDR